MPERSPSCRSPPPGSRPSRRSPPRAATPSRGRACWPARHSPPPRRPPRRSCRWWTPAAGGAANRPPRWRGAGRGEALAHARGRGVLPRDIKPANILLSRYGRPLLADFNIAFDAHRARGGEAEIGGTLAYMAPEHLDAFNPEGDTPPG